MQNATREAVKQMCYMVVNNSSMNGLAPGATITYTVPLWKKLVYLVDVICAVGIVLLIVAIVRRRKGAK
jgi:beta-glucosidase